MLLGQFIYACIPDPGPYSATPGWKITRVLAEPGVPAAALSSALLEAATASLSTFGAADIPLLAAPHEIDALPRRLRLDRLDARHSVLTHQSAAGLDFRHSRSWCAHGLVVDVRPVNGEPGTGLPDNGLPGTGLPGARPAQWWASPAWRQPVGPDAVRAAQLSAGFSPPPRTARWTPSPELAPLALAVLENALDRDPAADPDRICRLAIIDDDGSRTAQWVQFLTGYLSSGAAWTAVPFSTFEDVAAHPSAAKGLMVVGVPPDQHEAATALGPQWWVLDPRKAPPTRRTADPPGWQLPDGRWLQQGPWASLAWDLTLELGADRPGVADLPALLDALTGWTGGSSEEQPLWTLPATILLAGPSLIDADSPLRRLAARMAVASWPGELPPDAEQQAALAASLRSSLDDPEVAFQALLRASDAVSSRTAPGGRRAGSCDLALEPYLDSLLVARYSSTDAEVQPTTIPGVPTLPGVSPLPGVSAQPWVSEIGPLPWTPVGIRPGRALLDRWLRALPEQIGGALATAEGASGAVRLLTVVATLADRWGCLDAPVMRSLVVPPLVEAMLAAFEAGTPVADGGWPALPAVVVGRLTGTLLGTLNVLPGVLPVGAAGWMDAHYGPLDLDEQRHPLRTWTPLDLWRASVSPLAEGLDRDAVVIRAARLLRQAAIQSDDHRWSAADWQPFLARVLGPRPGVDDVSWLLHVLYDRQIRAPLPQLGEQFLAGFRLGRRAFELAQWLSGVASRAFGASIPFQSNRFPATTMHAACPPDGPRPGAAAARDPAAEPDAEAESAELSVLYSLLPRTAGELLDSGRLRLATDILRADADRPAAGRWPWSGSFGEGAWLRTGTSVLSDCWQPAFDRLAPDNLPDAAGGPDGGGGPGGEQGGGLHSLADRMRLARSLFLRSLLYDRISAPSGGLRLEEWYSDPAGPWLTEVTDRDSGQWRIDALVPPLLHGARRVQREQWITEVERHGADMVELFLGWAPFVVGPARDTLPRGTDERLRSSVERLIADNAYLLAFKDFRPAARSLFGRRSFRGRTTQRPLEAPQDPPRADG